MVSFWLVYLGVSNLPFLFYMNSIIGPWFIEGHSGKIYFVAIIIFYLLVAFWVYTRKTWAWIPALVCLIISLFSDSTFYSYAQAHSNLAELIEALYQSAAWEHFYSDILALPFTGLSGAIFRSVIQIALISCLITKQRRLAAD